MTLRSLGTGHQKEKSEDSCSPEKKFWVLRYPVARGSSDLGQTLLGVWRSRCNLLARTLELRSYLESESFISYPNTKNHANLDNFLTTPSH